MKEYFVIIHLLLVAICFTVLWVMYNNSGDYQMHVLLDKRKANLSDWLDFNEVKSHKTTRATTLQSRHRISNSNNSLPLDRPDTDLYEQVRILCWVMTSPTNLYTKAIHINATWGRHCNKLLFMSSVADEKFPAIGLDVKEGRDHLYNKTKKAFVYIWLNHRYEADWFLKADDDTYVILENLRYLLKDYNTSDPLYFGRKFKPYIKQGYMSGGAGYVLSREALARYVVAIKSNKICVRKTLYEDVEIGRCISEIGVKAMDSRDRFHLERFFPLGPSLFLWPKKDKKHWVWQYIYYPSLSGFSCCSNYTISFHYVTPDMMYVLEFFVYRLRVFGDVKKQHIEMKKTVE